MSDAYERIKGEQGFLEKIMSYIPGYHGYKEKELRRETDKLVREFSVQKLKEAKIALNEAIREVSDSGNAGAFQYSNRAMAVLDRVTNKIEHADYGYSGFFDAIKVRENKLDKLIEFDYTLIDLCKSMQETAATVAGQPDVGKAFNDFRKKLLDVESKLNNRESVIFDMGK
ncbi:MAG: hypothetical protein ABSB40_01285 [Nitrososphaeria archaeon]|jgi:hypothetical protein